MSPFSFVLTSGDPGSTVPQPSHAEAEALDIRPQLISNPHHELPESATHLLKDYSELLAVYGLVNTIPGGSRRTKLLCWAQLRQYALNSRATKRRIEIKTESRATGNRTSELCTYLAIDCFQPLIWRTGHKTRTDQVHFHHPQPLFNDLLPDKDLVGFQLTLWIHFLAATVEQVNNYHGQQKGTGHAHRFFVLMKESGMLSAQDLRRVFEAFPRVLKL